ncbi:hypothetical protein PHPALM_29952 [Phytophthora palmivora]|uniref:Uncharacterized protein n=1 Tax=Phytophthora palmivora TaxID=4796 RepID=A0A2P4X6A4_9STRA|nr:hypothetical protein PHPALM_29952 [Phytophthora palmivora]
MANVMNRLAACADDAAIMTELRAILCGLAGTEGRRATLDEMAAFLTATEERWTLATQTLISDLSGEAHAQFELLDTLLAWATQETVDKNDTILETLILFFQVATMRLGDAGGVQRWLQWGDQVLAVVHQNAALMEEQKPQETEEKADEGIEGLRCNVVKIASLLMQLRDKLEEDDDATPDLKMVTFVWKVVVVLVL